MSGADLGGGRCQQCGGPITGKGRRDRKYCSASCRTVAWGKRAGKDSGKASIRASATKLDDGLVDKLADAVATRLAEASIGPAARRPDSQPVVPVAVTNAESETTKQLQAEMAKIRAEIDLSRSPPRAAPDTANVESSVRPLEDGKQSPPSHQAPISQPRTVRLLVGNQAAGLTVAATSQLEQMKARHRQELAAKNEDHEQLTREFSALFLAHNKIETALENATTEKQSLTKRIRDLERQLETAKAEAENLRKTLEPLRQVLSEEDPLLFLMRSKVNLQHLIAVGRESIGSNAHGRRLPDEKPETRQAAAVYAAHAARQEFFALRGRAKQGNPTWVVEGRRLDPISEQKLRRQEEETLGKLEQELSLVTRLRAGT